MVHGRNDVDTIGEPGVRGTGHYRAAVPIPRRPVLLVEWRGEAGTLAGTFTRTREIRPMWCPLPDQRTSDQRLLTT